MEVTLYMIFCGTIISFGLCDEFNELRWFKESYCVTGNYDHKFSVVIIVGKCLVRYPVC